MNATATALSQIANALEPSPLRDWLDWAQLLAALASLFAVLIAVAALRAERNSRTSDSLLKLIEYFDANGYFLRMWRLEQASRTDGDYASTGPAPIASLMQHAKPVISDLANEAFASDWNKPRADMYAVYFFALRMHAWLGRPPRFTKDKKVRQLNDTFGHQLLGTFLNHGLVACRVRKSGVGQDYYPTHYGLFDSDYQDLVRRLGADLLSEEKLHPAVRDTMRRKRDALNDYVSGAAALEAAADLPPDEFSG